MVYNGTQVRFLQEAFDESMRHVYPVKTTEKLLDLINTYNPKAHATKVKYDYQGHDKRNGWNSWLVSAYYPDTKQWLPVACSTGKV